jgi:hypothetical protein
MASRGGLDKLVSVFPIILIVAVFVLLWQYGSVNRCYDCTEVKDWNRVQPIISGIFYRVNGTNSGSFEALFQNTLTVPIRITGISVTDNLTATTPTCYMRAAGGVNESGNWSDVTVKPRGGFELVAACPTKNAGDSYDLQINMTYTPVLGEANVEQTESGKIAGPVKYYAPPRTGNTSS